MFGDVMGGFFPAPEPGQVDVGMTDKVSGDAPRIRPGWSIIFGLLGPTRAAENEERKKQEDNLRRFFHASLPS
jgi:hypothetical protein